MNGRDQIQQTVDRFCRSQGFEKKHGTWYSHAPEVIALTNLQKSQYGRQYYLNQAFWLNELGAAKYPKEWDCHVRSRLELLAPDAVQTLRRVLDLDSPISDEDRDHELWKLLESRLLPNLDRARSAAGLRDLITDWPSGAALVSLDAQLLLGLTPES